MPKKSTKKRTIASMRQEKYDKLMGTADQITDANAKREVESETTIRNDWTHYLDSLHDYELCYLHYLSSYRVDVSFPPADAHLRKQGRQRLTSEKRFEIHRALLDKVSGKDNHMARPWRDFLSGKDSESAVRFYRFRQMHFAQEARNTKWTARQIFEWIIDLTKPVQPTLADGDCEMIQILHKLASLDREMRPADQQEEYSCHQDGYDIASEYRLHSLSDNSILLLLGSDNTTDDRLDNLAKIGRIVAISILCPTDKAAGNFIDLVRALSQEPMTDTMVIEQNEKDMEEEEEEEEEEKTSSSESISQTQLEINDEEYTML